MIKNKKRIGKAVMVISMNLLLVQTVFADIPTPPLVTVETSQEKLADLADEGQEEVSTDALGDIQKEAPIDIPADIQEDTPIDVPIPVDPSADKESMQKKMKKLHSKTIPVGKITRNTQGFTLRNTTIPSYFCDSISYVVVSDLRQIGGNVAWNPRTKKITIHDLDQPMKENPKFEALEDNQVAYLGRDTIYINYQEVPAIYVGGKALVPAKWIGLLDSYQNDQVFKVIKRDYKWYQENNIQQPNINGINIWFDGKNYIEKPYTFPQLNQDEDGYYQDHQFDSIPDYTYLGFMIREIDGIINQDFDLHKAWLKNPVYYEIPDSLSDEVINQLFPPTIVKGVMKYAAGGYAKGETVSVQRAHSGTSYYLVNKYGNLVHVPWSSVSIKTTPTNKEQATKEQIEQYINNLNFSSKTPYFVWTDLHRQRTYVFKGEKNNWSLIKNMLVSSGRDITPTPRGNYTLNRRVPYFGPDKGYMAKNAYAFIGGQYLYHSVLFDKTGSYLLEGRGILGTKASQGCIRFSPEDSKWFYQTMPVGTGIYIN